MDTKIKDFLSQNKLLCWAMQDDGGVWCANAFYAFDELNLSLIIASHTDTRHIKLAQKNPLVSVNVAKFSAIAFLKGVQIKALCEKASKAQEKLYYARFPFAKIMKGQCFALNIRYAKFTDNALGKKLEFKAAQSDE